MYSIINYVSNFSDSDIVVDLSIISFNFEVGLVVNIEFGIGRVPFFLVDFVLFV